MFDDETPLPAPRRAVRAVLRRKSGPPTGLDDSLPAPAPAGPYGSSLASFDFTEPNGAWSLYAFDDDGSAGEGYLPPVQALFETRPKATVELAETEVGLPEGTSPR